MTTKSTDIIALVDYFWITDGLISKTKNILRLYNEWRLFWAPMWPHPSLTWDTGSDMSKEIRSAPEAERKTYLTVKTFTLRIFFSFIASFLSRANFSLPHTSRVIGAYPSLDPTHQENFELPREFKRYFRLTHGLDRQVRRHSQPLRQTWRTSRSLLSAWSCFEYPSESVIKYCLGETLNHVKSHASHTLPRNPGKFDWMHMDNTTVVSRTGFIRRSVKKSEVNEE